LHRRARAALCAHARGKTASALARQNGRQRVSKFSGEEAWRRAGGWLLKRLRCARLQGS